MSFSKLPGPNSSTPEFPSLFRTPAWISSWQACWKSYLRENNFPVNECFYYISLPLWIFRLSTAIPTGCGSARLGSIRSEYFELQPYADKWINQLGNNWQQLIISDIDIQSPAFLQLTTFADSKNYPVLQRSTSVAYGIKTQEQSFADYLSQLSQSARARLFNKRKKLEQIGKVTINNIWPDLDRFIELINGFHLERWGKPCYQGANLEFINMFLHEIVKQQGSVILSVMELDGQPISVLLDVEYQGKVYNFQAGFIEKLSNNIALGSLHLGYEIESAFLNPSIHYYDFMAGQGKNTDYKAAFANHTQDLATLYIIKPKWLYWLYRLNDRIKS